MSVLISEKQPDMSVIQEVIIGGRKIGKKHPPYVIAELSANHNGNLNHALKSIEEAKKGGANAIKLQTYTADTMTIDCDREEFMIKDGLWKGYKLYDLYNRAYTPYEWHEELFAFARKIGITCFSSPFDETAVDILEKLNCPAYKIASFEVIDLPLIKYVAQTGKPMVISTGMAGIDEIGEAVETARDNGCREIALLHCVSAYPAPAEQSNLRMIPDLAKRYGVVSGLSDHSLGINIALASVSLGACIIEKHFTLNRDDKGPDSSFSIEPAELEALCQQAQLVWSALGRVNYSLQDSEEQNIKFRRSLYIVEDIKAGDVLNKKNLRRIRPGYGISPKYYNKLLGKKVIKDLSRGTPLTKEDIR